MKEYKVPFSNEEDVLIEKKSRFIGRIIKVETEKEAREQLEMIRKQERGAVHNCFAYVVKEENIERFSDDGEPQGTAGKPILEVLKGREVTNVLCVVTRYFGGILLGTGGLVRAYSHVAASALEKAGTMYMVLCQRYSLCCEYGQYQKVQELILEAGATIETTEFTHEVSMVYYLLPEKVEALAVQLQEASCGSLAPEFIEEGYWGIR